MFRPFDFIKDSFLADYVSPTVTYYGFYNPSNLNSSVNTALPQFKMAKEVKDGSGRITSFKWSGNSYDQIWNDRATIVYYD
jgi:hypothetical protein